MKSNPHLISKKWPTFNQTSKLSLTWPIFTTRSGERPTFSVSADRIYVRKEISIESNSCPNTHRDPWMRFGHRNPSEKTSKSRDLLDASPSPLDKPATSQLAAPRTNRQLSAPPEWRDDWARAGARIPREIARLRAIATLIGWRGLGWLIVAPPLAGRGKIWIFWTVYGHFWWYVFVIL